MALSVIGAGVGRTGTTTLKFMLEQLGFGPCHHMLEVIHHPETIDLWIAAAEGRADWEAIFTGYASAVDWPEAAFWQDLIAVYPDAKVILTERDPESWFNSTQKTILSPSMKDGSPRPMSTMMGELIGRFTIDPNDHEAMIAAFKAHNDTVRRVVPPERLLVYRVSEGWAPLCAFLGVPVPDGPVPHENSTEEFQARLDGRMATAAGQRPA